MIERWKSGSQREVAARTNCKLRSTSALQAVNPGGRRVACLQQIVTKTRCGSDLRGKCRAFFTARSKKGSAAELRASELDGGMGCGALMME